MDRKDAKRIAGEKAVEFVKNGMIVGLGTGSTSEYFIRSLGKKVNEGISIQAVASSRASAELARKCKIPLIDINDAPRIDLTVDGADEIDGKKRMIKGGGGALLREKILASSSNEMVVIVDSSKIVEKLGRGKLPVEILYYGSPATRKKLENLGYHGKWRMDGNGAFFITENGNLIFDISYASPPDSPEAEHEKMIQIPGVIETGFFVGLAGRVVVGHPDGRAEIL